MGETGRAHLAMLVFAVMVSTSFTVGAAITDAVDPIALTWLRFLMAAAIFAVLLGISGRIRLPLISDLLRYGVIGALLCIYFVTMFWALRWTDPVSCGAVFTLAPVVTALISLPLLGQRTDGRVALGLLTGGLGAIWVLFDGSWQQISTFSIGKGELVFLVGTIAYATYSPTIRRLHRGESLLTMNLWVLLTGSVMLLLVGGGTILETPWRAVPWTVYAGIAWLAAASTALSFYMIKFASLRLPSAKVLAYTYLIPALVLVQTAAMGEAWPNPSEIVGILVITGSMLVLQRA